MKESSWPRVFGEHASELFMSWGYARAVEMIARAGQKEYPLFVPEVRKDPETVSHLLYAVGHDHAIGVSPFGIEDLCADPATLKKPPFYILMALNIDVSAMDSSGASPYLSAVYDLIRQIDPLYFKYRGTGHMQSFVKHGPDDGGILLPFESYDIVVSYERTEPKKPVGGGMIFEVDPHHFLILGMNFSFKVYPKLGQQATAVIGQRREGKIENGQFIPGRILNGDERRDTRLGDMPEVMEIEMYLQ